MITSGVDAGVEYDDDADDDTDPRRPRDRVIMGGSVGTNRLSLRGFRRNGTSRLVLDAAEALYENNKFKI